MTIQHLRSSTANKRPTAAAMSDGQLAVNTNATNPGLFFKDADGSIRKVGPVFIGSSAPNSSPATGGSTGHAVGEQWLDNTGGTYVLKIWDGTAWRSESGTFVDVSGDTMTGALGVVAGSASAPGVFFSGDTNTGLLAPAADSVAITTGGTQRIVVDSSGRVGIGVSPSAARLHVETTSLMGLRVRTTGSTTASPAVQILDATGAKDGLFTHTSDGIAVGSYTAHPLTFITQNSEKMRLDTAGRLLLGTTTEGHANADDLTVSASGDAGITIRSGASNYGSIFFSDATSGSGEYVGAIQYNHSSNFLTIGANGSERMRIDSAGRLGLGTSSPTDHGGYGGTLEISGSPGGALYLKSSSDVGQLGMNSSGLQLRTRTAKDILFTTNNSERMRIDSSGNVGIGETSAEGKLHVKSSDSVSLVLERDGTGDQISAIVMKDGSGDFTRISSTAGEQVFGVNGSTEAMRIDSSGRVGIGTTSPGSLLQVTGQNTAVKIQTSVGSLADMTNGTSQRITFQGGNAELGLFKDSGGNYSYVIGTFQGSIDIPLVFRTGNRNEAMRIDSSGRLLVGTTSSTDASVVFQNTQQVSFRLNNTNSSPVGMQIRYTTDLNNIANRFIDCIGNATSRFIVRSNGGVENYSANNVNLCDEREKKNIASLDEKWDKVKSWELKKFHYNEDADTDDLRYGVIAQQVETTCPEVLTEWEKQSATEAELDEDGNVVTPAAEQILRKGVREQQMMWMAIKALQEAQARIETLEQRLSDAGIA
nr:putative endosialidase [uncultured Mediterranean phage uvMED]